MFYNTPFSSSSLRRHYHFLDSNKFISKAIHSESDALSLLNEVPINTIFDDDFHKKQQIIKYDLFIVPDNINTKCCVNESMLKESLVNIINKNVPLLSDKHTKILWINMNIILNKNVYNKVYSITDDYRRVLENTCDLINEVCNNAKKLPKSLGILFPINRLKQFVSIIARRLGSSEILNNTSRVDPKLYISAFKIYFNKLHSHDQCNDYSKLVIRERKITYLGDIKDIHKDNIVLLNLTMDDFTLILKKKPLPLDTNHKNE